MVISGSLILSLKVSWFLGHSTLDLLLPIDISHVKDRGSIFPELAAVFNASKLLSATINEDIHVRGLIILKLKYSSF